MDRYRRCVAASSTVHCMQMPPAFLLLQCMVCNACLVQEESDICASMKGVQHLNCPLPKKLLPCDPWTPRVHPMLPSIIDTIVICITGVPVGEGCCQLRITGHQSANAAGEKSSKVDSAGLEQHGCIAAMLQRNHCLCRNVIIGSMLKYYAEWNVMWHVLWAHCHCRRHFMTGGTAP